VSADLRAILAGVAVGDGLPVAVMGALNVSPESFYGGSVHRDTDDLLRAALGMVEAGAAFVDVGARSTAPYLETAISPAEEAARLGRAVRALAGKLPVPVSADTMQADAAAEAAEAGARIVNDVSGLRDPALGRLVAKQGLGLIAMASPDDGRASSARPSGGEATRPVAAVGARLAEILKSAAAAGIPREAIVLDPGIGFFREGPVPWDVWDVEVLAHLDTLHALGRPLCVGVSRKSFLGAVTGRADAAERLPASLAACALAVAGGAAIIRTHDVAETVDAVRVAERVRRAARS
jgi:dihydropteroate synthase